MWINFGPFGANVYIFVFLKTTTTSVAASVKKDKKGMNNVI